MRTDTQVLEQILAFARTHDSIRAVVMNGSRVNPNAPKDMFQDYDVVCYTSDPRRFLNDQSWIASFGELVILQQNDFSENGLESFIFLMLFADGVRIDLAFDPLVMLAKLGEDSLTRVLLDKDGRIPPLPPESDLGYHIARPTRKLFDETLNEIFWCSNNIAKGLWRGELAYHRYMFEYWVRPCLVRLLEWYAAMRHGWAIGAGAYGKWLQKFLPPEIWDDFTRTYAGVSDEDSWRALFATLSLARRVGLPLADHLGYAYPLEGDRRVLAYLEWVRSLPPDHQENQDAETRG